MSDLKHDLKPPPQVFVSYAITDSIAAKTIVDGLRSQGLNVWLDVDEVHSGESIAESIRAAISASAYFLLLLSKRSVNSLWVNYESETILKELQSRNITFLPVLLEDCDMPPSLAKYQWFDLRSGVEENLEKLTEALRSTLKIDFEKLSPQTFEQLVADLLQKLGFVKSELKPSGEGFADSIVEFRHKDPFGAEAREIYIVELKLYRNSRADLRAFRELAHLAENYPKADKALLITNGNLTSIALDWVSDTPRVAGIPIRVIEGTELKRLLLKNTDLVSKYFSTSLSTAS
jgi:hypothetical protein